MGLGCDEQVDQERQIFPALYFDGFFPAFDLRLAKESDAQILHIFIIHAGEARASSVTTPIRFLIDNHLDGVLARLGYVFVRIHPGDHQIQGWEFIHIEFVNCDNHGSRPGLS